MSKRIRIAVDAMSGDFGPRTAISGLKKALQKNPFVDALLVGQQDVVRPLLESLIPSSSLQKRIELVDAASVITMSDQPVSALRHKRDSSMALALAALANGDASACVSAGNTGALLALSRALVGMKTDLSRPALAKYMPCADQHGNIGAGSLMLDLGANPDATAEQLLAFARIGCEFSSLAKPTVRLLNIGIESGKGGELIRQAEQLLGDSDLNYQGYIEADRLLSGDCDIIVCDGFAGNIALKASEGAARFIAERVREDIGSFPERILAVLAWPLLKRWRKKFNPGAFNGALLLGLNGVVYKSHGSADDYAFSQSILAAAERVQKY